MHRKAGLRTSPAAPEKAARASAYIAIVCIGVDTMDRSRKPATPPNK
jgi:hypothetical protein